MRHEDKRKVAPFADPKGGILEKPESAGEAYCREFLQGSQIQRFDPEFLGDLIDAGELLICPVCRFLRLPRAPFKPGPMLNADQTPADVDCDICRLIPATASQVFGHCYRGQEWLDGAIGDVARLRLHRAELLFLLYAETSDAAEAVCWASMQSGLLGISAAAAGKTETEGEGADHANA